MFEALVKKYMSDYQFKVYLKESDFSKNAKTFKVITAKKKGAKMKSFLLTLIVFFVFASSQIVNADPFVSADPQCFWEMQTQDGACPQSYEISTDDGATWTSAGSVTNQDQTQIALYHDLNGSAAGPNEILIRGRNPWGVSPPVPFDFIAGPPSELSGAKLVLTPPF